MTEPRLRPIEKPKHMTDQEWELSACDKSPTGAHWFKPAPSGTLQCVYCKRFHDKIYAKALKREGRPHPFITRS